MPARREVPTFCRVCEPACGLVATVEGGRLVDLAPDRDHPITRGYACHKGLAMLDLHHDPDRVDHPLRRAGDGFEATGWDEAMADIAGRLRTLLDTHGPESIGVYVGNPLGFNALGNMAVGALFGQLGPIRFFSAGTQDCANKFTGAEAVFGSRLVHPLPDLDHADLVLSLGANPRVSNGSFMSWANVIQAFRAARARGAAVYHVNPVRIEDTATGAGETILIRPDTDLYLLAALLSALDDLGAWHDAVLAEHAIGVDELRDFVHRYPPERVADVCGIPAARIRALADEIAAAPRAAFHLSTGVNMGRQGTLAYWLLQALTMVTGNLDRVGGNLASIGFYPNARSGRSDIATSVVETEFGTLRRGSLPGNLLSHFIVEAASPVRALVVVAGNPLLSIGGEAALREAFAQLELLVVVDLYANATAEYADWVLPAADPFEREDLNMIGLGLQAEPWVQVTPQLVDEKADRRNEWWIFARLAQELGLRSALDGAGAAELWAKYDHMLASSGLTLDEVREAPRGIVLPGLSAGRFYDEVVQHPHGRVDLFPAVFAPACERAEGIFEELAAEPAHVYKLISRRDSWMHNSWMHNLPRLHRGNRDHNAVFVHPDDAADLGVVAGQRVRVRSAAGEIELPVAFDERLMRRVVACTHGWGNGRAPGMSEARRAAGANVNALLPIGPGSFEPLSSQAHMTGIPVTIELVGDAVAAGASAP